MTVALASVGLWRNEAHDYWWTGEDGVPVGPLPSVTGIIRDAVDKSGPLIGWATNLTAEFAVSRATLLADMALAGGTAETARWLAMQAKRDRDTKGKTGTRIHALCDAIARGETPDMTPDEAPYIAGFRTFLRAREPRIVATEQMGVNLTEGYAGTFDLIVEMDGKRWMLDVKTGKGLYPEMGAQLAAYTKFDFLGKPNDPTRYPMPRCQRFGILHLRPEGYGLAPFAVDKGTWEAFRAMCVVSRWVRGPAKSIMNGGRDA